MTSVGDTFQGDNVTLSGSQMTLTSNSSQAEIGAMHYETCKEKRCKENVDSS